MSSFSLKFRFLFLSFFFSSQLTITTRMKLGHDASLGVSYLHSLVPPVIHTDLKSLNLVIFLIFFIVWGIFFVRKKNVNPPLHQPQPPPQQPQQPQLVDEHWIVKIANFGGSRIKHLFGETKTRDALHDPAWKAPEVKRKFL